MKDRHIFNQDDLNDLGFFEPWVGEKYENGFNGKKVLAVGASHYCDKDLFLCSYRKDCLQCSKKFAMEKLCPHPEISEQPEYNYLSTRMCIEYLFNCGPTLERHLMVYNYFHSAVVGRQKGDTVSDPSERKEFWNSVAFFNFYQNYMLRACQSGYDDEKAKSFIDPLKRVIKTLSPDIVFFWGANVERILKANLQLVDADEEFKSFIYFYEFEGKNIVVMFQDHPTSRYAYHNRLEIAGISYYKWTPIIRRSFEIANYQQST